MILAILHCMPMQPFTAELHPELPASSFSCRTGEHQHAGFVPVVNRKVRMEEVSAQTIPPFLKPAIDGCQLVAEENHVFRQRIAVRGCEGVVCCEPRGRIGLKELALAAGCRRVIASPDAVFPDA